MPCTLCPSDCNQYDPSCLECGGRYLRAIQRRRMPEADKRAWLRKALADWMEIGGHPEGRLRELAKAGR